MQQNLRDLCCTYVNPTLVRNIIITHFFSFVKCLPLIFTFCINSLLFIVHNSSLSKALPSKLLKLLGSSFCFFIKNSHIDFNVKLCYTIYNKYFLFQKSGSATPLFQAPPRPPARLQNHRGQKGDETTMHEEQIKRCATCCHCKKLPTIEQGICTLHGPVPLKADCPAYRYDVFLKPRPKRRSFQSPLGKSSAPAGSAGA